MDWFSMILYPRVDYTGKRPVLRRSLWKKVIKEEMIKNGRIVAKVTEKVTIIIVQR
jgi:hypothetical protein